MPPRVTRSRAITPRPLSRRALRRPHHIRGPCQVMLLRVTRFRAMILGLLSRRALHRPHHIRGPCQVTPPRVTRFQAITPRLPQPIHPVSTLRCTPRSSPNVLLKVAAPAGVRSDILSAPAPFSCGGAGPFKADYQAVRAVTFSNEARTAFLYSRAKAVGKSGGGTQ